MLICLTPLLGCRIVFSQSLDNARDLPVFSFGKHLIWRSLIFIVNSPGRSVLETRVGNLFARISFATWLRSVSCAFYDSNSSNDIYIYIYNMSRIQYEITMYLSKKSGSNEIVVLIRRRHFECVYFKNNILKNFLVTFIYDFWSSILSKNTHVKFHVFDQDKFQWKWTPLYNKILGGYSSSHQRNFQGVPIVHKYAYVRPCVHARHILPNQFHTDVTDTFVFLVDWTISRFTLCLSLSFSHPLTSFSFEPYPFLTTSLTTTQGYVATLSCSKAIFEFPTGANYRGIDLVTSNERDEITFWSFRI